jgi:hypothetical protein
MPFKRAEATQHAVCVVAIYVAVCIERENNMSLGIGWCVYVNI